jgi:hypothetical protein
VSTTSLLGRERAIGEVAGLVERPRVRLVTLTGPGGVGKTRLAVAAGERLRRRFAAGTVFVPLEAVTDPGLVLAAIGRPAGANLAGADLPTQCDAGQQLPCQRRNRYLPARRVQHPHRTCADQPVHRERNHVSRPAVSAGRPY